MRVRERLSHSANLIGPTLRGHTDPDPQWPWHWRLMRQSDLAVSLGPSECPLRCTCLACTKHMATGHLLYRFLRLLHPFAPVHPVAQCGACLAPTPTAPCAFMAVGNNEQVNVRPLGTTRAGNAQGVHDLAECLRRTYAICSFMAARMQSMCTCLRPIPRSAKLTS